MESVHVGETELLSLVAYQADEYHEEVAPVSKFGFVIWGAIARLLGADELLEG